MSQSVIISWSRSRVCHKPNRDFYDRMWKKARAKTYSSVSEAGESYWDHVTNAASQASFDPRKQEEVELLLSSETLPENSSFLSFSTFAKEYPDRFFHLLSGLRPEFQELCIEYYLLHKSQSFIGKVHGFIQTRTWQALRIIEQTMGSAIILGTHPTAETIRPILQSVNMETTVYGSLTDMIQTYTKSQSYAVVAKKFHVPVPAIRKIFRPAIAQLLAAKDIKAISVGAYLRSITHWASLTKVGLSKSCLARLHRVCNLKFTAPPIDITPLISFGPVANLGTTPWMMLEISSAHRMAQLQPLIQTQAKRLFGKKAAQIFAPTNAEGELSFGYIFARCATPNLVRSLTHIRGISEMATACDGDGEFLHAITVPNVDVQKMIAEHPTTGKIIFHRGAFVEILTGPAAGYCGEVVDIRGEHIIVQVNLLTERQFRITADPTALKLLIIPKTKHCFWGTRL